MIDLKNFGYYLIYFLLTCGCIFSNSIGTASSSSSSSNSNSNSGSSTDSINNNIESVEQYSETLDQDKIQDFNKRPSFFVGSRYGRSGTMKSPAPLWTAIKTLKSRRLNLMPRNDRFFLSSRYGKRHNNDDYADLESAPFKSYYNDIIPFTNYEQKLFPIQMNDDDHITRIRDDNVIAPVNVITIMKCVYTGLTDYYRCSAVKTSVYHPSSGNYSDRYENYSNDLTDVNKM